MFGLILAGFGAYYLLTGTQTGKTFRREVGLSATADGKKRFRIRYRDLDPGAPDFSMIVKAYDREHAEEKFWDSGDGDDGWRIVSIEDADKPAKTRRRR
jgi:hypothetical protein